MNKMEYQKPWAEVVEFSNEDVITTSGCGKNGSGHNLTNEGCPYGFTNYWTGTCVVTGDDGCNWLYNVTYWCTENHTRAPECGVDGILENCGTNSENGRPIGCEYNWSDPYSLP